MCSSTRVPASVPSLVTWPTSRRVTPARLVKRISSCALARTWATVPGAESNVSTYIVWIESITSTSGGGPASSVVTMSRTSVAAARSIGAVSTPMRPARRRTWSTASSPEMYTQRAPPRASEATAWRRSEPERVLRAQPELGDGARGGGEGEEVTRWGRLDHRRGRGRAGFERRDDVAHVGGRGEVDRRRLDAHAPGAQAHLVDRRLAGDVHAARAAPGQRGDRLE